VRDEGRECKRRF
jgi:hypothetical protein